MGRSDGAAARGNGLVFCCFAERIGSCRGCPDQEMDLLSASYLIALAARVVPEISDLDRRANVAGKHLATLSVGTVVRFRSAEERAAFSNELAEAINRLVSKYHDESAPGCRAHRLVLMAHPLPETRNQS